MNRIVRGLAIAGLSVGALVSAAGCGGTTPLHLTAGSEPAAARESSPTAPQTGAGQSVAPGPAATPANYPAAPAATSAALPVPGYQGPHFDSPESAMTYLAAAYNSGDAAALHALTTPSSYLQLTQMWSGPVNLQLQYCTPDASRGDYYCYFSHDFPASLHKAGQAVATMLVAPALNPGWYLYTIVECG